MKQGADADTVARQYQAAFVAIPQRNRKLTVQVINEIESFFLVQMHQRLGVTICFEAVPALFQISTQLKVIENLTVK